MAELRDQALLLRRIPYGDSSLICHFLTEQHGRIALMAKAARRVKSPFRAELAPLYHLEIGWRSGRSGMGTLADVRRGPPLLSEMLMLDGLELLAVAARLFQEGDTHGFLESMDAIAGLAWAGAPSGLPLAIWRLFDQAGWLGDLGHCWQCDDVDGELVWQQAQLLCGRCCSQGMARLPVSLGLRKSVAAMLAGQKVQLSDRDLQSWRQMIRLTMQEHGVKLTESFGG